ncbi:MAG: hypothetical protein LBC76_05475 [Treponema sp.]|nr:hypothetical protein [Treponema sp.]
MNIFCKKILVGVFVIFCITIIIIIIQQRRQRSIFQNVQYVQEDKILPYIKDGDIICRLGDRIWSMYFKELSPHDKRFSHLGIIRIRNDIISVINAEGLADEGKDFVNEVPLREFLKSAQKIGIFRLRTIEGEVVSNTAIEYIGLPFDWQFDMEDNNKLYCTELLYVILKKINVDIVLKKVFIKEIGKNIIPLDICSQSEYFMEIGYWEK